MGKKTPLYQCHLEANAKIVDFAGWDMPLHYGSQIEEHHHVRRDAGLFDVSHMTIIDVEGEDAASYLRRLLANNVDRLKEWQALYSCMLNKEGGVVDDLIVYKLSDRLFRLVVNAGTREKDLAWLRENAQEKRLTLRERWDLAMLALQGPRVCEKLAALFSRSDLDKILSLNAFHAILLQDFFIARTGYTGEDGFEILLPQSKAPAFWQACIHAEITPCGLGARDTLRLEAGLNLYGADMDETVTPLESNLSWTVAFHPEERDFIGREALQKKRSAGVNTRLAGLILETAGVLRNHQKVIVEKKGEGYITSGSFSPSLNKGIALARIPLETEENAWVEIRGKRVPVKVIKPPFVRRDKEPFLKRESVKK